MMPRKSSRAKPARAKPRTEPTGPPRTSRPPRRPGAATPPDPTPAPPPPSPAEELRRLTQRAKSGDAAAVAQLRRVLDTNPEIWETVGDLGKYVEAAWLDLAAGGNPLVRESIKRHAEQMRSELAGPHPTRAEKMLVDQAVCAWMEAQYFAYALADQTGAGPPQRNVTRLKQSEVGQRKFLAAVKMLATLRALVPRGLAPLHDLRIHDPEARHRTG